MVRENVLTAADLIWPIFVVDGKTKRTPIPSMPGVDRLSIDEAMREVERAAKLTIPCVAIFPYTDPACATRKAAKPPIPTISSAAPCARSSRRCPKSASCATSRSIPSPATAMTACLQDGVILNDETVEVLTEQALVQAAAGCDIIAPSDMMDGRVGAIRVALDDAQYQNVSIMAYAAKYASAFYGPFRDAVGSSKTLTGDKRTYQMDYANSDEAIREVALDLEEGADMVMVKPGLPYLDIVRRVKTEFGVPTFAYQVSGEYSMISAAVQNGWLDGDKAMIESLMSFKRAGADGILTYFAPRAAEMLRGS